VIVVIVIFIIIILVLLKSFALLRINLVNLSRFNLVVAFVIIFQIMIQNKKTTVDGVGSHEGIVVDLSVLQTVLPIVFIVEPLDYIGIFEKKPPFFILFLV